MFLHTPQGRNCPTFQPPPLDGSLTVPEIFYRHGTNSPNHPLFIFEDAPGHARTVLYPEAVRAMQRVARIAATQYSRCEDKYIAQKRKGFSPTFGVLAVADTISYFSLMIGLMRTGCTVFPISTRNSPAAVAHLIAATGVIQLFVSSDPAMQRLTADALEILAKNNHEIDVLPMPQFADDSFEREDSATPYLVEKLQLDKPALIAHSSGSTAFPKPIILTHRILLQWGLLPYHGELDICAKVLAAHSLPMFHAMGIINLSWTCCTGMIMGCFKPTLPPVIPTPEYFLKGIVATKSNFVYCVPSFVEHWAQSPDNIPILKSLSAIIYAGAPMSKLVGDELARQGVPLIPFYGATETGCVSIFLPAETPSVEEWEYFKLSPHAETLMLPQDGLNHVFELVMIEGKSYTPGLKNRVINGRNAYATNDLLLQHPTDPKRWRVYGRADDQIMHSTGEKTNPGPLEAILSRDPHVTSAIMFGRGKLQNGVLIEPRKEFYFNMSDDTKLAEFRNAIWPSVEKVNQFAPSHSRLFKEMIIVTNSAKPLEYTAKGTPRRHVVLKAYSEEIEAAYAAVKDSAQTDLTLPHTWTHETTLGFVRTVVKNTLDDFVRDTDDIFWQHGCDSLQATRIRNAILHALRETSRLSVHDIPHNFVYANPSISNLAVFIDSLFRVENNGPLSAGAIMTYKAQEMEVLVEKYTAGLPAHRSSRDLVITEENGEVILITGTTGRFGCYLLAQLIAKAQVIRIIALNRPSARGGLDQRQRDAFGEWGLDIQLLTSSKLQLLEADFAQPFLGLAPRQYDQIRDSITSIIHNAWRVDFNLALSSFEPLIIGVRNFIDLSLSSPRTQPPRILFTSSISVLRNHPPSEPAFEISVSDARTAVGAGYSEGKWVAERILELASLTTTIRSTIVRVGQLSGDSQEGRWTKKEWVPAMIRGGQIVGCLPLRSEDIGWVPADVAATVVLEMRHMDEQFFHLAHLKPVRWSTLFGTVADILQLPLVSYDEWLARLEAAQLSGKGDALVNPALKLLDFFRTGSAAAPGASEQNRWITPRFRTDRAGKASPALTHAAPLDKWNVEKWVAYWKKIGFLDV